MKQSIKSKIKFLLLIFLVCSISSAMAMYFFRGIHIYGLPKAEEISFVEIKNIRLSSETRQLREPDDIKNARNVSNLLNYKIGKTTQSDPIIFITYHLNDGEIITVCANEDTVFWKDKEHELKDAELFINVVEGLFFGDMLHDN